MHEIVEENTHIRMLENFNLNNNTHIVSMSYAKNVGDRNTIINIGTSFYCDLVSSKIV